MRNQRAVIALLALLGCQDDADVQAPPGVNCAVHDVCPAGGCPDALDCFRIPACLEPICISPEQACRESCRADVDCLILDSYPGQVQCRGDVVTPGWYPDAGP